MAVSSKVSVALEQMKKDFDSPDSPVEEPAPVFRGWSGWYVLVLATLLALIVLFYVFTKAFE